MGSMYLFKKVNNQILWAFFAKYARNWQLACEAFYLITLKQNLDYMVSCFDIPYIFVKFYFSINLFVTKLAYVFRSGCANAEITPFSPLNHEHTIKKFVDRSNTH